MNINEWRHPLPTGHHPTSMMDIRAWLLHGETGTSEPEARTSACGHLANVDGAEDIAVALLHDVDAERRALLLHAAGRGRSASDAALAVKSGCTFAFLPAVRSPADIQELDVWLSVAEAEGEAPVPISILAGIGGASDAILSIDRMSAVSQRIAGLFWDRSGLDRQIFGASGKSTGRRRLSEPAKLVRSRTVLAACASGLPALDTPSAEAEPNAFEEECLAALNDGFRGKIAIAPWQVPIIERVFKPTPESTSG